jgi:hypothetical protein
VSAIVYLLIIALIPVVGLCRERKREVGNGKRRREDNLKRRTEMQALSHF